MINSYIKKRSNTKIQDFFRSPSNGDFRRPRKRHVDCDMGIVGPSKNKKEKGRFKVKEEKTTKEEQNCKSSSDKQKGLDSS